jgi:predicted helicase
LRAFAVKNLPIMTDKTKARVFHSDLQGRREEKYDFLNNQSIESIQWAELEGKEPYFFFVPMDFKEENSNDKNFKVDELFLNFGNGIGTDRDSLFYDKEFDVLKRRFEVFYSESCFEQVFQERFNVNNSSSYNILFKRQNSKFDSKFIKQCLYRPFDRLFLYHNPLLISRSANDIMSNFRHENYSLLATRQVSTSHFKHVFISNCICDRDPLSIATKERTQVFPLYLYPESKSQSSINQTVCRTPNLNSEIVQQVAGLLALTFTNEKEDKEGTFAPIDLLDYIYAVLHSPTYRAKYKEFLKIDFPRVPYPKDNETFWKLVKLGGELRQIHLLESPVVEKFITSYPNDGANQVVKITYEDGKVRINEQQYFDNVPPVAWNFYIGGYQPAQKWLKDRKGRTLYFDDIMHYQKIIVALTETSRIMKEIDGIEIE